MNFVDLRCVQELCERLWDISETRKEQSNRERDVLMHGGRLEDQAAVLVNHHAILLQVASVLCVCVFCICDVVNCSRSLAQVPSLSPLMEFFCFQVELDRFQATLQVLKVYYLGMRGDVLPELSPDILKVTLQEAVEIQDKYEKDTRTSGVDKK